jgi:excisionase family DNA binding protein
MAQYYTLEEAARVLHMSQDEVKKLAEEKKVRTFRDRGTLRFRAQDIDEVARSLGLGSEPELQLGEVPPPKKGNSPTPKKVPKPAEGEEDVFDFNLSVDDDSDQVEIGHLPPSSGGSKGGPSSSGRKRSPPPEPGSDSDVRLVPDGGDVDFELSAEDGPASPAPKAPSSSTRRPSTVGPGQPKKPSSSLAPGEKPPKGKTGSGSGKRPSKISSPDSSVRMVPMGDESDSDVKMVLEPDDAVSLGPSRGKSASDSDIRLEHSKPGGKKESDDALVTEEIDLDAEVGPPSKPTPKPGAKPGSKPASGKSPPPTPKLPKESPFELSESDLDVSKKSPKPQKLTQHKPADTDSSDDFELTPAAPDSSSPLELGSDEVPALPPDDDEVNLGELNAGAGDSGINLRDPADSGISLEQEGSDEIEFELSLDAGATPKPSPDKAEDSSDEFELSLDDDSSETVAASDSSEFELSLEDSGSSELDLERSSQTDSDSEFELTLDESAGSSPLEEGAERDIFETDFEVPALEEESGSEAVALDEDTDLESSDFDLALGDEDMAAEDESGSQVVALEDEEEADEGAATVSRQTRGGRAAAVEDEEEEEESEFAGIGAETEEEEDEETAPATTGKTRFVYVDAPPAPWGPAPALLLIPCVLVLFVVGLMGFELVQSMLAYQKGNKYTGLVIGPLSEAVGLGTPPGIEKKGGKK